MNKSAVSKEWVERMTRRGLEKADYPRVNRFWAKMLEERPGLNLGFIRMPLEDGSLPPLTNDQVKQVAHNRSLNQKYRAAEQLADEWFKTHRTQRTADLASKIEVPSPPPVLGPSVVKKPFPVGKGLMVVGGLAAAGGAAYGLKKLYDRKKTDKVKRAALLDELVKIASEKEAPKKRGIGGALRTMGVAAAGGALGYGAADLAAHHMKFFTEPNEARARAARIILPILSGAAVTLADRYRQRMNKEYKKVTGYKSS